MEFNDYLVRIYNGESLIFEPDGTVNTVTPENDYSFGLEELQHIVNGWIEILTVSDRIKIVMNEEGATLHLPLNVKASLTFGVQLRGAVLACQRTKLE